jgi:hypothetical protein
MKNIHVLPTDKPSRLYFYKGDDKYPTQYGLRSLKSLPFKDSFTNQNIYITSDEEIKEGDWYLIEFNGLKITQCTSTEELISIEGRNDCKKIILTTDQDLIKDYRIQAIDDEFLEWFVKNPSCEEVEVEKLEGRYVDYSGNVHSPINYKIIIPKDEAKQENDYTSLLKPIGTKQSAVEWLYNSLLINPISDGDIAYNEAVFENAKVLDAQQQGYSEEDMIRFMQFIVSEEELENTSGVSIDTAKYFLNKFKNK